MHQQFNLQQLYVLPTLYLCVLYLSQRSVLLTQYCAGGKIETNEMGRACGAYGGG